MERLLPFQATRGSFSFSFLPREGRRCLALVVEGSCLRRGREGVSRFAAPFALAFPDGAAHLLRTEGAAGVGLSLSQALANELSYRLGRDDAGLLCGTEPVFIRLDRAEFAACRHLFEDLVEVGDRAWGARGDGANPEAILAGTCGILVRLRRLAARPAHPDRSPQAVGAADIRAYLDGHFREPLSLDAMATEFGYSPAYVSRYFKRKFGSCLFEYLNSRRIAEACALLKTTDKTVTEIAFEVGYNNLSFFNRYFRKLMDASPQEFRRKAGSTTPYGDGA